jgi:hypothetical protein
MTRIKTPSEKERIAGFTIIQMVLGTTYERATSRPAKLTRNVMLELITLLKSFIFQLCKNLVIHCLPSFNKRF